MDEIGMSEVATLLHQLGVEALVDASGGTEVLVAGPTWVHPDDGTVHAVICVRMGRGHLSWGPDIAITDVGSITQQAEHDTAGSVADDISAWVRVTVAATMRAARDAGITPRDSHPADEDLTGSELDRVQRLRGQLAHPDSEGVLRGFHGWDVRPYGQRDGEPTEVDVVVPGDFDHDVPVYEGSAGEAWNFLAPGRYRVRVVGLSLYVLMDVTEEWSGVIAPTPVP